MRPVQLILIAMIIGVIYLYFSRLRSGILDRVAVLGFAIIGIVMAAFPDLTHKLAAAVGVGRGVDLFIYLALVGFAFFGLVLYSKIRDLQATITELARSMAVEGARAPSAEPDPSDLSAPSD